jgi:DNA-binding GntR family transcriptional regulator
MTEGVFPALTRQGLTEAVEQAIRRAILEGRLAAGERLVEARISEELGVSRAPVREALARLAQRGLVVSLANRGTFVVRLGPEDVGELFTLRVLLEGHAASCLASAGRLTELAYLEQLAESAQEAARVNNAEAAAERDLEFSAHLVGLAGSRRLLRIWQELSDQLRLALPGLGRLGSPAPAEGLRRVLDALRTRDPEAARRAMADHLARWRVLWLRAVSEGG